MTLIVDCLGSCCNGSHGYRRLPAPYQKQASGVFDFSLALPALLEPSKAITQLSACGSKVEMLGSIGAAGAADWSVLIMDPVSTRVMSHACQISEILDYGISCR